MTKKKKTKQKRSGTRHTLSGYQSRDWTRGLTLQQNNAESEARPVDIGPQVMPKAHSHPLPKKNHIQSYYDNTVIIRQNRNESESLSIEDS